VSDQKQDRKILPLQTQAILFDLDDTLHHRHLAFKDWAQAFAQTYYAPDQSIEIAEMCRYLIEIDQHGYTPRDEYFQLVQQRYPFVQGSWIELTASYQQRVIDYIVLEDEIGMLLQQLKEQHVPIGIITNGETVQQKRKIAKLKLEQFTSCIFVSQEFGVAKPDPSIFLAAAHSLQLDPEQILFVGDNPVFDIWGAHQVGMKTVWIHHETRSWPDDVSRAVADITVHAFADLLPLFGFQSIDNLTGNEAESSYLSSGR
jgi:putative hydrolase of the HAD superfamily